MSLGILSAAPRMARPIDKSALGAAMSANVPKYFSYEAQHWSQYPDDVQKQINAQANLIEAQRTATYKTYVAEGACDGTRSGRLAGGLKERLLMAGADPNKLSPDPAVFGAKECAEWWNIFQVGISMTDAQAVSKDMLDTICKGVTVRLPSCPKPAAAPPPVVVKPVVAPIVPITTQPKSKYTAANIAMVGGALAAVSVIGYAVAKKKGWIKAKAG